MVRDGFKRWLGVIVLVVLLLAGLRVITPYINLNPVRTPGEVLDEFNGIPVYYNGGLKSSSGLSVAPDGYTLGLRYQCAEFVKRYYHQRLRHTMPDARGHGKNFFSPALMDGEMNPQRRLIQYSNPSVAAPQVEDIVVFGSWWLNRSGHVAIVTRVDSESVEIIQQNPGPFGSAREVLPLRQERGVWRIGHRRVLGWLHRPGPER